MLTTPSALPASFEVDPEFPAAPLASTSAHQVIGLAAATGTNPTAFAVRGVVESGDLDALTLAMRGPGGENRVFADPGVGLFQTCGGTRQSVRRWMSTRLLGVARLRQLGMDGRGIV